MKPLPQSPALLAVAERVVWFKPPAEALAEPVHFLAHVMTFGTPGDLRALDGIIGIEDFRDVLDNAPLVSSINARGLTGTSNAGALRLRHCQSGAAWERCANDYKP